LTFHEEKRIQIMAHLPPKDADDEAPHGNLDNGDLFVTEPSWDKKLLIKVRKTFCL
jgi:hypothetical protein